ncbi:coenzyme F420-0:L-glutamate ligase [Pelagibacterium luteolum]|uniref:Coenzyme F420-0:L-glutamate ligase / coenzyme F420-1:gamma-L-glutamate ligase n=1 Tax=Pelagibacterium luteolum TaxID=440168 RepID=A0A1G7XR43_9HYPH|nr:coenzyme F420-0:L-glutamate ligase [Pelagibacterium luteolum]SDG86662.1 coenzyme F420-0:L-glutamate ligase / coenzyme F420-1:gamma-L-glutamate ligase [Pelagibacterium luteolum]
MVGRLTLWGIENIPEIGAGDDLVSIIAHAIEAMAASDDGAALRDGDILVVTSKIVSKAEGMQVPIEARDLAIDEDTVRVVAERVHAGGTTKIVETRQGLVMAAAGLDTSNVPDGLALRLPRDPDASAKNLCAGLRERTGRKIGIIITDTLGRPWRVGQTDAAIGAAGVQLVDDLRGGVDANGRPLNVTVTVVADELAAAADLVKGKASGIPVAVARGLSRLVGDLDTPGARTLARLGEDDMFRFGSTEAYAQGYEAGMRARATAKEKAR